MSFLDQVIENTTAMQQGVTMPHDTVHNDVLAPSTPSTTQSPTTPVVERLPATVDNVKSLDIPEGYKVQGSLSQCAKDAKPGQELFTVEKQPVGTPKGLIGGDTLLFVGDRCINKTMVSSNYEIHQPREIYALFKSLADKTGLEVKSVIGNPHNGGILISAKHSQIDIVGEKHDINLTLYTAHDGKCKTTLVGDGLRMDCWNQVPLLIANKKRHIISEKHTKNTLNLGRIEEAIAGIPEGITAYEEQAQLLNGSRLTLDDFLEFYIEKCKMNREAKRFDSKIDRIKDIYKNGEGQAQILNDTAYKAYQTVTYINTHEGMKTSKFVENSLIKGPQKSLVMLDEIIHLVA